MKSMADITLGIKKCSMMVAQILADFEPEFLEWDERFGYMDADFSTRTLYNGRERGLVFQMTIGKIGSRRTMNVFVVEHRNTDSILATRWVSEDLKDTLSVNDIVLRGETPYPYSSNTKEFDYSEYYQVAKHVYKMFELFYNANQGFAYHPKNEEVVK